MDHDLAPTAPEPAPEPPEAGATVRTGSRFGRRWKLAIKLVVGLLVLAAVGKQVITTWHKLEKTGQSVRLDPGWTAASVALYLVGLSGFGVFFWRIMAAGASPIGLLPALRAYLIGHLGKYVPGKALVVVVRVGLVVRHGARAATAAFATFYETLVMMAAGGLIAAAGFAVARTEWLPMAVALGLGLAFLVVVEPWVFPKLSRFVTLPLKGVTEDAFPRFSYRLLAEGLAWSLAGWLFLGFSQVAIIRALGVTHLAPTAWPLVVASVALATVIGFVAGLPGGLGAREWVLMKTLAPALGGDKDLAVVAALALRLAWVLGELLAAGVLSGFRPPRTRSVAP